MRVVLLSLAALSCDSTQTACVGCLNDPPRICGSSCVTRLSADGGGGPYECACVANDCTNTGVTYSLVCDDIECQCAASGAVGNAGGSFPSPKNLCESDVSVIEGLFNTSCSFPPK